MFIANCTMQVQDFQYRTPESQKIRQQMIPILGQVQLSGDLNTPEIDFIVEQHAPYGLVHVKDVDRTKPFVGTCYDVDKRIDVEKIRVAHAHNQEVLTERGKEIRKEAAVVINDSLEKESKDLLGLELSIVEDTKTGKDVEVNERIKVDRTHKGKN